MPDLSLSVQYHSDDSAPPPRHKIRRLVRAALPNGGEVTVRFVSATEMSAIGKQHHHNKTADILSFAYHQKTEAAVLGDVIVCPEIAAKTAASRSRHLPDHLSHLIVHGALHLAGYNHKNATDAGKMENIERTILARFGIADPYQ